MEDCRGMVRQHNGPVGTGDRIGTLQKHILGLTLAICALTVVPKRGDQLGWTWHRSLQLRQWHGLPPRRHLLEAGTALLECRQDTGYAVRTGSIADVGEGV